MIRLGLCAHNCTDHLGWGIEWSQGLREHATLRTHDGNRIESRVEIWEKWNLSEGYLKATLRDACVYPRLKHARRTPRHSMEQASCSSHKSHELPHLKIGSSRRTTTRCFCSSAKTWECGLNRSSSNLTLIELAPVLEKEAWILFFPK